MKCDNCGIESPVEQAFRRVPRLFKSALRYCPNCKNTSDSRTLKYFFRFIVALCAISLLLAFTAAPPNDRAISLFWPTFFLFYIAGVALHEVGHVLVAALVGFRVFGITLGWSGRTIWRRNIFGIDLHLTSLPLGGLAFAAPRSLNWLRLRWTLFVAAGPATNILLALAVNDIRNASFDGATIAAAFFWSNIAIAAISLFPCRYQLPLGPLASDGLQLLTLPFDSRKSLEQRHAAYFVYKANRYMQQNDYAGAKEWSQKGLQEYPGDLLNETTLALTLMSLGDFSAARELYIAHLHAPDQLPAVKAILLNNVAYANLFIDDPTLLDEADRFSQEAMQLTPWVRAIQGTRGAVLVELGQIEEGIVLLKTPCEENERSANKALTACYLAIAYAKQGDNNECRRYLESAESFDPQCRLIPRVQIELAK